MIISHKYKYLFIELGRTASCAISRELCEYYDGKEILRKHADYRAFHRIATPEERKYFVFSTVRNPLDRAVSIYFKLRTNHRGRYSKPELRWENGGNMSKRLIKKYEYVKDNNADFPEFFRKYYRQPYVDMCSANFNKFNFIIRYEDLESGFAQVLKQLGINQKRSLPVLNKTIEKNNDFYTYFTPEIQDQAKRVFAPYLKKFGYDFPLEWTETSASRIANMEFKIWNIIWTVHEAIVGRAYTKRVLSKGDNRSKLKSCDSL